MTVRIQKILLPTDFSDYSDAAIKYAWELAIRFEAEIHVLHALENHLSSTPSFAMGLDLPGFVSESSQTAKKKLTDLVDAKLAGCRKVIQN